MYFIVIGQHFQPFCGRSSLSIRVLLGCIGGLGASEGGALWGFYGLGMSLPGGVDFWSWCYCMHCVLWYCVAAVSCFQFQCWVGMLYRHALCTLCVLSQSLV